LPATVSISFAAIGGKGTASPASISLLSGTGSNTTSLTIWRLYSTGQ
jgi:hypothetical protein